jgi:MFS family permease
MSVRTSTSVSPVGLFNSFSGSVQKNLAVLFTAQALNTGAITVSTSLSSIVIVHITGADRLSGLPSTINFFMSAVAAFWAGRLMAAKGRRIGLSLGYAIGFLGAALAATMALEKNLIGFLIGGAMVGVANGAVQQARYAVADMVGASVRGTVMGWILTGSVFGSVVSNVLSSLVRTYAKGINLPEIEFGWYLGAVFMLIAGIIVWFFLRPDPKDLALQTSSVATLDVPVTLELRSWKTLLATPQIRLALSSMTFGQGVMVMLMVLMPLHADHLGIAPLTITSLITSHIFGMFGFSWLTGRLADVWGRRTIIMLGALQLALSGFIAIFATRPLEMGISLFLLGTGWNFCSVGGSTLLTDALEPSERARVQGGAETLVWIFAAIGALGGGLIAGTFGFPILGVISMIAGLVPFGVALATSDTKNL